MRTFTVKDWTRGDLLRTGSVAAVNMRPQQIAAAEPYCLKCGDHAWPARVLGRWDSARKATALPFDPVWVVMSCGCTFGDAEAAR